MDYTHKISNLGDGYPSNGEIIVDNDKNILRCISISDIHLERWERNWVYALCEPVVLHSEAVEKLYDIRSIKCQE
jgi:hypothetical protein